MSLLSVDRSSGVKIVRIFGVIYDMYTTKFVQKLYNFILNVPALLFLGSYNYRETNIAHICEEAATTIKSKTNNKPKAQPDNKY